MDKEFLQQTVSRVIAILCGVGGILLVLLITGNFGGKLPSVTSEPANINPIIGSSTIESIQAGTSTPLNEFVKSVHLDVYPNGLVTPASLISACNNPGQGVQSPQECNQQIAAITRVINVTKQPTNGWLYVKAGVSRSATGLGPLDHNYDAVWFLVDDSKNGGELFLASATVSGVSSDGFTEALFPLNKVTVVGLPYSETKPVKERTVNLANVLTPGKHYVAAFVSSLAFSKIISFEFGFENGAAQIEK